MILSKAIKNETLVFVNFSAQDASILKFGKRCKSGVFWNPQDLLLMVGTEIFKIDASWAEKLAKTRVSFLMTPSVEFIILQSSISMHNGLLIVRRAYTFHPYLNLKNIM